MICDLSGKEERLCEHRTKIKRLIHCTSVCRGFCFIFFQEDLSMSGNRNSLFVWVLLPRGSSWLSLAGLSWQ